MKIGKKVNGGFCLFITVVLALFSALSLLLPFTSYYYKSNRYTLTGLEMLTGKTVMSGSVTIAPVRYLAAIFVVAAAVAVIAVLQYLKKLRDEHKICVSYCVLAVVQLVLAIVFVVRKKDFMTGTKQSQLSYGVFVLIAVSLALLARGIVTLYQQRYVVALDFMVLPGMFYLLINNYLPMIGISFAFKNIDFSVGIWRSEWNGLENFKYLFSTSDAFIITRNTLCYNLVFILLSNVLGVIVGIALAEAASKWLKKISQSCILLPQLISAVILAYIVYGFLSAESGFINTHIVKDGYIDFYNTRIYWPFILVFVYLWKQIGYTSMIYLSSIISIDRTLYEASYIDGCDRWKQIKYITLPLLKPSIITMVLLQVGRIFYSDFGLFYQVPMDSGSLYRVTNTIDTFVYRSLMKTNNISLSAAASTYQAIVGFIVVMIANAIVRKIDKDNALF